MKAGSNADFDTTKNQRFGKITDTDTLRRERTEILRAFPRPENYGRKQGKLPPGCIVGRAACRSSA
jgi:hypothetical protein